MRDAFPLSRTSLTSPFSSFFVMLYSIPSHNIKCGKIFQALIYASKTICNLLAYRIHGFF